MFRSTNSQTPHGAKTHLVYERNGPNDGTCVILDDYNEIDAYANPQTRTKK